LFGGGGGGTDWAAVMARNDEKARQASVRAEEDQRQGRVATAIGDIDRTFSGFDDNFYTGRSSAYTDYAMPQLEEQFGRARDELTYGLARGGNLNSSLAATRQADLRTQYDRQRQQIIDQGLNLANQARGDINETRSSLVSQAQSAADPAGIAGGAGARAATLAMPQTFSPLMPLFTSVTAGLAAARQAARDDTQAQISNQLLYQTNPSASRARNVGTGANP